MPYLVILIWFGFRTVLIGLAIGLIWWLVRGRKDRLPVGAVAFITLTAVGLALACIVFLSAAIGFPVLQPPLSDQIPQWVLEARITWSLAIGIGAAAILDFPLHAHTPRGQATLTQRTPFSFGHRWWFAGATTIIGTTVTVTVLAGLASEPDEEGLWRSFTIDAGTEISFGTGIYGWYYSLPSLALLAVLIAVTMVALWLIARPAISTDQVNDVRMRQLRTRNILAVTSGALLIHLGAIFTSLAATASLHGGAAIGESGWGTWNTPFAAIQSALTIGGLAITALGYALWFGALLSALPSRRAASATVRS
ncbi:hypothetical protein [Rhodoglobus aureus]|uniref:Uncharacterized protein n=1 Tax=Rhodoglobus aureus TaxID=191497 RepID=A0ABN1VIG2_9MICO